MIKISFIAGLILIFTCCHRNDHESTCYNFLEEESFINKIEELGKYSPSASDISDEFISLVNYFHLVTGHSPSVEYKTYSDLVTTSDSLFYPEASLKKDTRYWMKWYSKNYKKWPQEVSDSIYARMKR